MAVMAAIRRLARRYDSELLEKMIYMFALDEAALQNVDTVASWCAELVERVNAGLSSGQRYECAVAPGGEDQPFVAKISKWTP